ncbi:hypothetical protein [Pontibacillus litoralis]|uniref:Flagellar protein FliT n=1 Tax=Pontibacillus litoralis JSM 072002 TaxID=1385512 RepID=A0A0A5G2N6_9BACI|nr:hypothetical protein [Pontibacillus litoralis]KGX86304.1 hypothetical protein N784_04980 [Pontibacillus litoralis JSM 072002]
MERLNRFYDITLSLYHLLQRQPVEEERLEHVEKIQHLLAEREQILLNIKRPETEEGQVKGKEILAMDEYIKKNLNEHLKYVKSEIARLKRTKTTSKKYINPYKSVSNYDGMFLDKKK